MSLRTLHPEPSRLIPLGEAARVAGVPHLRVRRAVASGDLVTLPALHLGQRIRLVEPAALEACFPQADLRTRRPFDPAQRGIEWIGVSASDQPPQDCLPSMARDRAPSPEPEVLAAGPELDQVSLASGDTTTEPEGASTVTWDAPGEVEASPASPRARLSLASLVDASFGGPADPATARAGSPAEPPREPAWEPGLGEAPDLDLGEGPARHDHGATDTRESAPVDSGLAKAVARYEGWNRGKRFLVHGLLTAWAVVLVAAWLQLERGGDMVVFASWLTPGSEASRAEGALTVDTPGAPILAESGDDPIDVGPELPQSHAAEEIDVVVKDEAPLIEASTARVVKVPAPVEVAAEEEGPHGPGRSMASASLAPRFAGTACTWWAMTQPGADLRPVLGPCKGPWDDSQEAVVGLHRDGSQALCSHHLRFVRELGGDLEAELASALAAREGGLPPPLLAMRIDGAARALIRERVGRWLESGFETGRDHQLTSLGGDRWGLRTWVVAAQEDGDLARLRVELELSLADGPHQDTLESFVLTEDEGLGRGR